MKKPIKKLKYTSVCSHVPRGLAGSFLAPRFCQLPLGRLFRRARNFLRAVLRALDRSAAGALPRRRFRLRQQIVAVPLYGFHDLVGVGANKYAAPMIDSHFLFIDPGLELELRQFFADSQPALSRWTV